SPAGRSDPPAVSPGTVRRSPGDARPRTPPGRPAPSPFRRGAAAAGLRPGRRGQPPVGGGRRAHGRAGQRDRAGGPFDHATAGRARRGLGGSHPRPRGDPGGRSRHLPPSRFGGGRSSGRPDAFGHRCGRPDPDPPRGAPAVPRPPRGHPGRRWRVEDRPAVTAVTESSSGSSAAAPFLEATDVWKSYRRGPERVRALAGVTVSLRAGEVVALVGRSGSGKTTLLNVLCGWERPDRGDVVWRADMSAGTGVAGAAGGQRSWSDPAIVPQGLGLLEELSVEENVELPLRLARHR